MNDLLGWKKASEKAQKSCIELFGEPLAPNLSDVGNKASMRLAAAAYEMRGIPQTQIRAQSLDDEVKKKASGTALEVAIESDLSDGLPSEDPHREWSVSRGGNVSQFAQFTHLNDLQAILVDHPTLRATFAGDYQIQTDVWVGVPNSGDASKPQFLHAAISSKWTIRSDRVQNVRHEFATLVRNRRGRCPHLVLVTAEPLPTRVLSIARGTGELDAVYHLLYDELDAAVPRICGENSRLGEQQEAWNEMVSQNRLRPYSRLVEDLVES